MHRRLLFPGGEINPTNDELNLMADSNRGGIFGLAAALSGSSNNVILSGVNAVIGASSVTVQAGYVFLNGEVLEVEAGVINDTVGNDLYIFQKVQTLDDSDYDRSYRDNTTHNVAEFNYAVPVPVASIGSNLSVDGESLLESLQSDIRVQANWAETDTGDPSFIQNKPTIPDVRNIGSFGPLEYGSTSGANVFTGDVTNVSASQDSTTITYTVTMANAMSNTNYLIRHTMRSNSGSLRVATDASLIVFRPISTTQFSITVSERFAGNAQDCTLFIEAVDIP